MVTSRRAAAGAVSGVARRARFRDRAPLLASLATLMLGACALQHGASDSKDRTQGVVTPHVLSPLLTLSGARLVSAADPTGTPLPRAGAAPLTPFIHPVAAATLGNDLYIADAGAGRVFRFDLALNVMTVVQSAPAAPGTRLAIGSDFSLYVLDRPRRRVLKLARDGRLQVSFVDASNLSLPVAMVLDDVRGQFLVADELYHHLVAFHPLGGAAHVVHLRGDGRDRVMGIAAIALAREAIHISDGLCRCIVVVARDGAVRSSYGHQQLGLPGAIAIDRYGRVFVADVSDSAVKVFSAGRLIDHVPLAALGLREASDLSVSESRLVVADGAGARVAILRIAPPAQGG